MLQTRRDLTLSCNLTSTERNAEVIGKLIVTSRIKTIPRHTYQSRAYSRPVFYRKLAVNRRQYVSGAALDSRQGTIYSTAQIACNVQEAACIRKGNMSPPKPPNKTFTINLEIATQSVSSVHSTFA